MQKGTKISELIDSYEKVCSDITAKFTAKHGLQFDGWIGNEVGGIALFNCQYSFGIHDIVLDLQTNQKKWFILQWQDDSVDHALKGNDNQINYKSYTIGLRYDQL